ncbi:apolipoprotein C-II-like [Alosa alosa]|nr:apolipoprotein C-II-like [Alosa alosa]
MRKLLVCAVLLALLAFGAESSRVARQAEEEGDVPQEEAVAAPAQEEAAPAPAEEEAPHAEHSAPAPAEEEAVKQGTAARVMNTLRSYYDQTLNTASGYLEDIRELKLEEKAKNLYVETTTAVRTYAGVMQDQLYHMVGSQ